MEELVVCNSRLEAYSHGAQVGAEGKGCEGDGQGGDWVGLEGGGVQLQMTKACIAPAPRKEGTKTGAPCATKCAFLFVCRCICTLIFTIWEHDEPATPAVPTVSSSTG
eukprot:351098-Chlamydomonas_euryale.AAC.2